MKSKRQEGEEKERAREKSMLQDETKDALECIKLLLSVSHRETRCEEARGKVATGIALAGFIDGEENVLERLRKECTSGFTATSSTDIVSSILNAAVDEGR